MSQPTNTETARRTFLRLLAGGAGAFVLNTTTTGCLAQSPAPAKASENDRLDVPRARPDGWDPIAFNRTRGNAGAIPESYRAQINGPEGATKHLGKHLPYAAPKVSGAIPSGVIALMWGDPATGYAPHPNAPVSTANPNGHWYNWVRIRKAVAGDAEERESRFSSWPQVGPGDSGAYGGAVGADPSADSGRNTVYLAQLPLDVRPGDLVRVHAHCLTHGEYVDFITVPG